MEVTYSGYNAAGVNVDELGQIIDAFAHLVFNHTDGNMILADLQGSTLNTGSVI